MDITTEAVRMGLDIAQLKLQMASFNISHADTDGMVQRADFSQALGALDSAVDGATQLSAFAGLSSHQLAAEVSTSASSGAALSLDDLVAQASIQGGVYRALSEGMSRRFGLMQLAISGK
ncbi:hypothetical protein [Dyella ginsengisoli]|uniref:hypothetical protein n=1 Tax=Dyella ginsengisoli TaxID=363848 RepID=UPI00034C1596|nr:hypothetical protein [Dyella ginsengisoli]